MTFLRLDGKRRNRAGVETTQADGFAGFLAIAVGTVINALQGCIDLGNQLALTVAGTKFDGAIGFR